MHILISEGVWRRRDFFWWSRLAVTASERGSFTSLGAAKEAHIEMRLGFCTCIDLRGISLNHYDLNSACRKVHVLSRNGMC